MKAKRSVLFLLILQSFVILFFSFPNKILREVFGSSIFSVRQFYNSTHLQASTPVFIKSTEWQLSYDCIQVHARFSNSITQVFSSLPDCRPPTFIFFERVHLNALSRFFRYKKDRLKKIQHFSQGYCQKSYPENELPQTIWISRFYSLVSIHEEKPLDSGKVISQYNCLTGDTFINPRLLPKYNVKKRMPILSGGAS